MRIRILRHKKGLSAALSSVLMIATVVTVGIAASSWLGSMTTQLISYSLEEVKITDCEWAEDYSFVDLKIKNVGSQGLILDYLKINGELVDFTSFIEGDSSINVGRSSTARIQYEFSASTKYQFDVLTKRRTQTTYTSISQPTLDPTTPSVHYIDTTSNIDGSIEIGEHSSFSAQQSGPDGLFDTLTEANYENELLSIIQFANISSSNVDGVGDVGTETNFVNTQTYSPDSAFMSIQEENLSQESSYPTIRSKTHSAEPSNTRSHDVRLPDIIEAGDTILVVFICDDNEQVSWENDEWTTIYEENAGGNGPTMEIAWKKANGNEDGTTIELETNSVEESVHMSYAIQNAADPEVFPPEASNEASGHSSSPDPESLSPSGGSKSYLWFAFYGCDDDDLASSYPSTYTDNRESYESSSGGGTCAIGAASREYTSSSDNPGSFSISSEQWEAATVAVFPETEGVNDYELDFEYQWTNADFDEQTEQVCIYVENADQSGENLVAYEWSGASWQLLGTLHSDGWNNFTSSLLSEETYTINIRDNDKDEDSIQSTWRIDCVLTNCSSTQTNYELDLEVQFTDVQVSNGYTEICIYTGSTSAESLEVSIWSGSEWNQISSNLLANQWNNVTQTITQNTVTLKFSDSQKISDANQDSWEIDCILLYATP